MEFQGGAQSRARPGVRDPKAARPHPPEKEPQVSKKLLVPQEPAPSARCGAMWGNRGTPREPETF